MRLLTFLTVFSAMTLALVPALCAERGTDRAAAVAGAFYPAGKDALRAMIEGFFSKVKPRGANSARVPSILIFPHAGYVYSGPTAAYAYQRLAGKAIDTVVLIGPCHRANFAGASVWPSGSWRTPLGDVEIDTAVAAAILKTYSSAGYDPSVHLEEHSLEVQLPFLQCQIPNFKIVPIVTNDVSGANCRSLAQAVRQAVAGKKALVVISTDMSHYHPAAAANAMDRAALQRVLAGDIETLARDLQSGRAEFCGSAAVLTAMEMARMDAHPEVELLDYSDSGDTGSGKSRVVGYGAVAYYLSGTAAVSRPNAQAAGEVLTAARKKILLEIARKSVESSVKQGKRYQPEVEDAYLKQDRAAFVTLRLGGRLRGCIGEILPRNPLYLTVRNMAIAAASEDPRFRAVTAAELKDLTYEISVLSVPVRVKSADEIVVGKHGVIVKKGLRQGVFLPKVAEETGWSKEEFLNELCSQKAGLNADAWKDPATELYVFTAEEFG
ncbi:MAG: AmmeMemoRadiSam system protein B [Candidatus Omnitrophota bacterium]